MQPESTNVLRRDSSTLLIIDMQERLVPVIADGASIVDRTERLAAIARKLVVPIVASQQYPKGLGPTVEPLASMLDARRIFDKAHFSCGDEPRLLDVLVRDDRNQIVICGMEAHICVLQTALDLNARGFQVFVVADAVGSRLPESRHLAFARLQSAGVTIVNLEMVLFEWLEHSSSVEFKELSRLIR